MKLAKPLIFLAACLSGTASLAQNCDNVPATIEAGVLSVAAYDYPPFSTIGTDGSVSGIDAGVVTRAAAANCLEVKFLVMEPSATIQSVISGKADIAMGSWARTAKRDEIMGLSAPVYLDPMGVFSREGSAAVADFEGKIAGTIQGFQWVSDLQAVYGSNLRLYPNGVAMAQDLAAGRIDVGFDSYSYGVFSQATAGAYEGVKIMLAAPDERVSATVRPSQAAILYTKGNDSLGAALDASIEATRDEILQDILAAGFDKALGDVGEARLTQ